MIKKSSTALAYIKQLDGLRFIAVFGVMITHWINHKIIARFPFAFSGVLLFYALSGFLITTILLKSKIDDDKNNRNHWYSLKQFYIRRGLRILPIYYLIIFALYVIDFKPVREVIVWLTSCTINIYFALRGDWYGAISHFWTLAVEGQFYLFFPFFILFTPQRYLLRLIYFIISLAVITRSVLFLLYFSSVFVVAITPSCFDSLGIGALLAYLSIYKKEKLKIILNNNFLFLCSALSLFLIMTFFYILRDSEHNFNFGSIILMQFLFSVTYFWIIGKASFGGYTGLIKHFLEHKIIVYLGKISYGLYLYHNLLPPFYKIFCGYFKLTAPFLTRFTTSLAIYFFGTIFISIISWHLVEKPINGLKKYFAYQK